MEIKVNVPAMLTIIYPVVDVGHIPFTGQIGRNGCFQDTS